MRRWIQAKGTQNKKPRIEEVIASRNPLERLKVTPVDLYQVPRVAADEAAAVEPQPRAPRPSETVGSRTPVTSSATVGESVARPTVAEDVVLPYSTRIRRSLIRAIRVMAFETDRKDREIVEAALEEYFEKYPPSS